MSKKKPKKDPSVAALKAEVRRLRRLVEPGGGVGKLLRYDAYRRLTMLLLELDDRAEPLRAQQTEVVLRKRGHGGHDGITTLGDHVATPGYAVGSRQDQGRLGAALARVRECADKVAGIADPEEARGPDPAIRCGVRACSGRNIRQRADITYCAYCGRNLIERTPAPEQGKTDHGPVINHEPASKQQPTPASLNGQAPAGVRSEDEKAAQLEADRAGLLKALEMAQGGNKR